MNGLNESDVTKVTCVTNVTCVKNVACVTNEFDETRFRLSFKAARALRARGALCLTAASMAHKMAQVMPSLGGQTRGFLVFVFPSKRLRRIEGALYFIEASKAQV